MDECLLCHPADADLQFSRSRIWEDDLWLQTYRTRGGAAAAEVRSWLWGGGLALAGLALLAAAGLWWRRRQTVGAVG